MASRLVGHTPRIPVASDGMPMRANQDLSHLPGPRGHWFWGNSKEFLPNPGLYVRKMRERYGDCFTVGVLRNRRQVVLCGPQANRLVLLDPDDNFSARWGWEVVHDYFPGMVLLRDFADHRQHRRIMTPLFKPDALGHYLAQMDPIIRESVETWGDTIDVYRAQKQLTLDIALRVFCGFGPGACGAILHRDLWTILDNVMALPGVRRWRGLRARDRLREALRVELHDRRERGGDDLFSRLATERDGSGRSLQPGELPRPLTRREVPALAPSPEAYFHTRLSDADVIDHMLGLLFASHDTTASALTTICMQLARRPDWQRRLREECLREATAREGLTLALLDSLPLMEAFFKETLRQYSPLQIIPRRSVRELTFDNHRIPANAPILLFPQVSHFDPEAFPEPERFDPMRFVKSPPPEPFAFIPFGRGSHMCLGMHFAVMEVKAVLYRLLLRREVCFADCGNRALNYVPIVRPFEPVRLDLKPTDVRGAPAVSQPSKVSS